MPYDEALGILGKKKGYDLNTVEGINGYLDDIDIPLTYLSNVVQNNLWLDSPPEELHKMKIFYFYVKHQIKELISLIDELDGSFT